MPNIKCTKCGSDISIDPNATPYEGDIACGSCGNIMYLSCSLSIGTTVKSKYPDPKKELSSMWFLLNNVEQDCLSEAAIALGNSAFTAAEFMALRNLESLCRRYYEKIKEKPFKGPLDKILDSLADDKDFVIYADVLNYFRSVRNRLAHPEKVSNRLDAESSYKMSLRLTAELLGFLNKE